MAGASGTSASITKHPVGASRSATARHAGSLTLRRAEVEERVEGDEHDAEWTVGQIVDHVAENRAYRVATLLVRQSREHRRARVDADHRCGVHRFRER